jgi:hypothetical protein
MTRPSPARSPPRVCHHPLPPLGLAWWLTNRGWWVRHVRGDHGRRRMSGFPNDAALGGAIHWTWTHQTQLCATQHNTIGFQFES